jgi:hypothetical protein
MTQEEFDALKPGDRVVAITSGLQGYFGPAPQFDWLPDWIGSVIVIDEIVSSRSFRGRRESDGDVCHPSPPYVDLYHKPYNKPLPLPG